MSLPPVSTYPSSNRQSALNAEKRSCRTPAGLPAAGNFFAAAGRPVPRLGDIRPGVSIPPRLGVRLPIVLFLVIAFLQRVIKACEVFGVSHVTPGRSRRGLRRSAARRDDLQVFRLDVRRAVRREVVLRP